MQLLNIYVLISGMQDESWVVKDEEALRQDDGDKLQAIQASTASIWNRKILVNHSVWLLLL